MKKGLTLIIGGAQGIGKSIFEYIIKKNKNTYVLDIKDIKSKNFIKVDLSRESSIRNVFNNKILKKNKIKNIIFCQRFRGEEIKSHFDVSLFSVASLIDQFEKKLLQNSSVIVINSHSSKYIADDQPLGYQTSKAALINLVKFYAIKFGYKKIRFNSIVPATTIKPASAKFYKKSNKNKIITKKIIPLQRLGNIKDIINLIDFLCSDKSSYITGQSIYLDGGLSLIGQETVARKLI